MILKSAPIKEVVEQCKGKKVYIFGTGRRLNEFLGEYGEYIKLLSVAGLIDNASGKQNKQISIGESEKKIISVSEFLKLADANTVILITVYNCGDIIRQLYACEQLAEVSLYIYGMIQTEDIDEDVYKQKGKLRFPDKVKKQIIPPIIHYCWFGNGKMSDLNRKCMESWREKCPDYDIICWNEQNYDITKNAYIQKAYNEGKWAFVSDYARLDVIEKYGGIYLDTDVELVKSLDCLLGENGFCGFQNKNEVNLGLGYGARKGNPIIKSMRELYDTLKWDGGEKACPFYQTHILNQFGLKNNGDFQKLKEMTVLPARYLAAKSVRSHKIYVTEETIAIHHFEASWYKFDETEKLYHQLWNRVNGENYGKQSE